MGIPGLDIPWLNIPGLDIHGPDIPRLGILGLGILGLDIHRLDIPNLGIPGLDIHRPDIPRLNILLLRFWFEHNESRTQAGTAVMALLAPLLWHHCAAIIRDNAAAKLPLRPPFDSIRQMEAALDYCQFTHPQPRIHPRRR